MMPLMWMSSLLITLGAHAAAAASCRLPEVEITTDLGPIVIRLNPRAAPLSAANFLAVVDRGLLERGGFYRVVRADNDRGNPKIDVVQGGLIEDMPDVPTVSHESTAETGLRHVDGAVSLARGAVGTGSGGAFFVSIGRQPGLDAGAMRNADRQGFAVFGRVVRGMNVIRKLHAVLGSGLIGEGYTAGQILAKPVEFRSVRRLACTKQVGWRIRPER